MLCMIVSNYKDIVYILGSVHYYQGSSFVQDFSDLCFSFSCLGFPDVGFCLFDDFDDYFSAFLSTRKVVEYDFLVDGKISSKFSDFIHYCLFESLKNFEDFEDA